MRLELPCLLSVGPYVILAPRSTSGSAKYLARWENVMTAQAEIDSVYGRWSEYGASVNFLRKNLIAPLESLGYVVEADPAGRPELRFSLPDGRRLGHLNTESFYFVDARDLAAAQNSPALITDTAAGKVAPHPRTRHNSANGRDFILEVGRLFAHSAK
jgi:hypothetical protein